MLCFGYGYALAQMALSELFLLAMTERLGKKEKEESRIEALYPLFAFVFHAVSVGFAFLSVSFAYLFLALGIYWSVFSFLRFYPRIHPIAIGSLATSLFVSLLLFAFLYQKMPERTGLVLLSIPFCLGGFCVALNDFLKNRSAKKGNSPS